MKKVLLIFLFLCTLPIGLGVGVYLSYPVEKLNHQFPLFDSHRKLSSWSQTQPRDWKRMPEISMGVVWPVVLSEDWAFYEHQGVDFRQLYLALKQGIVAFEKPRGASTITMQTAKNLFLVKNRSYWRKFKEIIIAKKMEWNLSKSKILETYLNIIEYGENLYGIGAASQFYFHKEASSLSFKEGAFLAQLLPNPKKFNHSFKQKKLTELAREKIENISIKLRQARILKEEQRVEMLEQSLWP